METRPVLSIRFFTSSQDTSCPVARSIHVAVCTEHDQSSICTLAGVARSKRESILDDALAVGSALGGRQATRIRTDMPSIKSVFFMGTSVCGQLRLYAVEEQRDRVE